MACQILKHALQKFLSGHPKLYSERSQISSQVLYVRQLASVMLDYKYKLKIHSEIM